MFDVTLFDLKFVIIEPAISEYISFQMHHVLISFKNEQKNFEGKNSTRLQKTKRKRRRNVFVRTKLHFCYRPGLLKKRSEYR